MERKKLRFFRFGFAGVALFASLFAVLVEAGLLSKSPLEGSEIVLSTDKPFDASLVLVTVHMARALKPSQKVYAEFAGSRFDFYPVPKSDQEVYQGVVAIPYLQKPGAYQMVVGVDRDQTKVPLKVRKSTYPSEKLTVDPSKVFPPPNVMPRISQEGKEVSKIYAERRLEKLWSGPFAFPIHSPLTSPFGVQRMYNKQFKGFHKGLDLKAAVGAEVAAPEEGVVRLAKDLYFTGGTIILDHGYGLMTLYAHLSELKVKVGQSVKKGEVIALAGSTGRATGPHLHWGAIVNGVKVNPTELTKVLR